MRALTPEASALLEGRWAEDGSTLTEGTNSAANVSAGFGLAVENREVERAAIAAARELLQRDGWTVTSVEAQRVGYDLYCTRGDEVRRAEVKGIRGSGLDFVITAAEYARAMEDSAFELIVVSSVLSAPQITRFSGAEIASQYDFAPIAYRASFLGRK
jgi:hypothetical protein